MCRLVDDVAKTVDKTHCSGDVIGTSRDVSSILYTPNTVISFSDDETGSSVDVVWSRDSQFYNLHQSPIIQSQYPTRSVHQMDANAAK